MRKEVKKLIEENTIIQAPMAGITTPDLVSEVSNQGGIGNIGAGYLDIPSLEQFIDNVESLTDAVYGVNLFVPEKAKVTQEQIDEAKQMFIKNVPNYSDHLPSSFENFNIFNQQVNLILKKSTPIVSFTFGVPNQEIIEQLKQAGKYVIGTATSVEEAIVVENHGCDAVVVQGSEAGGHRGAFIGEDHLIGLMSLIPQVADVVNIPVIASGGIMDKRGFKAAQCLGAATIQLGSAFLMTTESNAHEQHKEVILNSKETDTVITKAFSGKSARGVKNKFIHLYEKNQDVLPYPHQNSLTKNMRKLAAENNDPAFMSLWAGQSVRLSKRQSVKELIAEFKK